MRILDSNDGSDAVGALNEVKQSKIFFDSYPNLGPSFNIHDIAGAKNEIGCSVYEAGYVLCLLQRLPPENKSNISISKIKKVKQEIDCSVEEAIDVLMKLKDLEMESSTTYPEIKEAEGRNRL